MPDKETITTLEKKFWDCMVSNDVQTASYMVAKTSIVIGPSGIEQITRGDFAKMMEGSDWTLESYKISDTHVIFPAEGTAVIGYTAKQKGTMGGKPYEMEAAYSSTWVREGKQWLCALHTETVPAETKQAA